MAVSQPVTAPSFLDFSTFFQLRPDFRNTSPLTAPGRADDFYIAGTLAGSSSELAAFPLPPVNPQPRTFNRAMRYVARFSGSGELLQWRLFSDPFVTDSSSPLLLAINRAGDVVLVFAGSSPTEPLMPDGLFGAGFASMLVLSPDLRETRVSAFVAPQNVSVSAIVLDRDDTLVFSGTGTQEARFAGVQWNTPFVARVAVDGRQLVAFRNLDESLGATAAQRLAVGTDGALWLARSTSSPGYPVTGRLARSWSGTTLGRWTPQTSAWTTSLPTEMAGLESQVLGHPRRPGTFLAYSLTNLYRSTDSGSTWSAVGPSPGQSVVWSLADPARLYAWGGARIRTSVDEGATWQDVAIPDWISRSSVIEKLAVSHSDSRRIAFRLSGLSASTLVSSDGGETWSAVSDGILLERPQDLAFELGESGRLLLIDSRTRVLARDNGAWVVIGEAPDQLPMSRAAYHPGAAPVVSGTAIDGGMMVSRDVGRTWARLPVCTTEPGGCRLSVNPANSAEWWVTGARAWRSSDAGNTWSELPGFGATSIVSIAFSGDEQSTVLVSTSASLDIYLRKLNAGWDSLDAATYWGGSRNEIPTALLPHPDGSVTLVGSSSSLDYPTTADAIESGRTRLQGVGITRFSSELDSVRYSTTWGGSSVEDTFRAILLPTAILWCGSTYTADLPALAEPVPTPAPASRAGFVAGYDFEKNQWLPAYVFGAGTTVAGDCARLADGRWLATGTTDDSNFPRVRSSLPSEGAGVRAFVSVIRR